MTALIIGNNDILKSFLVNGYDETVIINDTNHPHLLDYITTHFVKKDDRNGGYLGENLIARHSGDVIYCSQIDVESIWTWEDRERGVQSFHAFQMPYMPPYAVWAGEGSGQKETRPSTEFIALNYLLANGYFVNIVGFSKNENANYEFENRFIQTKVSEGRVRVL